MKQVDTKSATALLRDGEILIAALDDMPALICDARNTDAVSKLRKLKNRSPEKGFSVLIDSDARLNRYATGVPPIAWDIIDTAVESLILVLPEGRGLTKEVLAADGTVAVRICQDEEERKLVQTANAPLACTALLNAEGLPASGTDEAPAEVLEEVRYVLSLPTAKRRYPPRKIPVIKLGPAGEVVVVRE